MQPAKHLWRGLFFILLIASLCGAMVLPVVGLPARAAPQLQAAIGVVISEFRFRGSAGAADEFVEIYNATASPVNLRNWLLRASNATGGSGNRYSFPTTADFFLQPGQHYLIANTGYNDAIPPDTTYASGITDDGGVALVRGDGSIADQVGLSTGSIYQEGTVLSSLTSNTDQGYERQLDVSGSCTDSNNNGADFFLRNSSDPQNASSPITTCGNPTPTFTPASTSTDTPTPTSTPTATNTPTTTNTATATSTSGAPLSVLINEVAWAGTSSANTTDEWIELYNPSATAVNLNGWVLRSNDNTPNISLNGYSIAANGYLVLARRAGTFQTPLVYSVESTINLANTGEVLTLIDPSNTTVDTANNDDGSWPAGAASPNYASMERRGLVADSATAWVTYAGTTPIAYDRNGAAVQGTPGKANWITTVPLTATITHTATLTPTGATNTPIPANIVISEFRTIGPGGGNDEFVELYNRTTSPVSIAGWEIRKSSGCGTTINTVATIPAGVALSPGQHYLIGGSAYSGSIAADLRNVSLGIADNGGIALFQAGGAALVDAVGLCSGTTFREGTALTQLTTSVNRGYDRKASSSGVCVDTNNNASDFFLRTPSDPQNLASPVTICGNATPAPTATTRPTHTPRPTPLPPPPLIAINEFVPRPGHDWNGDSLINFGDEYIELINHGVIDVNLSGYALDDEVNIGSAPFRLPADVTMKPGERRVFFAGETGLRLSDGGDGVRLLKPNGQLGDAYNYSVVRFPDQSYCRLPDNGGLDDWNQNCYPTPNLQNSLSGTVVTPPVSAGEETACPVPDTFPEDFALVLAECPPFGDSIWNAGYWDRNGWFGERFLPESPGKWNVFVD